MTRLKKDSVLTAMQCMASEIEPGSRADKSLIRVFGVFWSLLGRLIRVFAWGCG